MQSAHAWRSLDSTPNKTMSYLQSRGRGSHVSSAHLKRLQSPLPFRMVQVPHPQNCRPKKGPGLPDLHSLALTPHSQFPFHLPLRSTVQAFFILYKPALSAAVHVQCSACLTPPRAVGCQLFSSLKRWTLLSLRLTTSDHMQPIVRLSAARQILAAAGTGEILRHVVLSVLSHSG